MDVRVVKDTECMVTGEIIMANEIITGVQGTWSDMYTGDWHGTEVTIPQCDGAIIVES